VLRALLQHMHALVQPRQRVQHGDICNTAKQQALLRLHAKRAWKKLRRKKGGQNKEGNSRKLFKNAERSATPWCRRLFSARFCHPNVIVLLCSWRSLSSNRVKSLGGMNMPTDCLHGSAVVQRFQ
jgi:hypothetical protein